MADLRRLVFFAALACSACSGNHHDTGGAGTAASAGTGSAGNAAGTTAGSSGGNAGAGAGQGAGGSSGIGGSAGHASAGSSAGASGGGGAAMVISLPNGGQQYKTIVNIVDADAMKTVEAVLANPDGSAGTYAPAAQAFYALYPDEYDFLYFILDHEVGSTVSASFERVDCPAIPGTGIDKPVALPGYGTLGKLRGVAAFQYSTGMPPFAHETLHYWGVDLDPSFGFGKDRDNDYKGHWGEAGVYGQLGGFDPTTLRCATPAGAMPPACMAESNGRFRYQTSAFGPNTNSFKGVLYAPLELYLMGLVAQSDVPPTIPLMQDASIVNIDDKADTALVEASGITDIKLSDIVARHGARAPASDADKHFSAAFVVLTDKPASDSVLAQVVEWQEIFGAHAPAQGGWRSFADHTGGRATLTTRIGRRRMDSDPPPLPPVPKTCSVFAQDCGVATLGCYNFDMPACYPAGKGAPGSTCQTDIDCAPGNACTVSKDMNVSTLSCGMICDPNDDSSAKACKKLCPDNFIEVSGSDLKTIAGICFQ